MSKAHRGSGLRDKINHGRGTCPVCKRTGIKLIYTHEHNGKTYHICKVCRASIAHNKKQEELNSLYKN